MRTGELLLRVLARRRLTTVPAGARRGAPASGRYHRATPAQQQQAKAVLPLATAAACAGWGLAATRETQTTKKPVRMTATASSVRRSKKALLELLENLPPRLRRLPLLPQEPWTPAVHKAIIQVPECG